MASYTNKEKLNRIFNSFINKLGFAFFDEIARRALFNNAFDGALTLLGILMGNAVLGNVNPQTIISSGLGACLNCKVCHIKGQTRTGTGRHCDSVIGRRYGKQNLFVARDFDRLASVNN